MLIDGTKNPLIEKLLSGNTLLQDDRDGPQRLCSEVVVIDGRRDLIREGEEPEEVHLVLSGYACRYKMMDNGHRSIMALLIPGDFCDLNVAILGQMDHTIATLGSHTRIVRIPRDAIDELLTHHPRIARALWWATLVDEGTLREWLANMGRRPADQQMAHLFCEMFMRMKAVGQVNDGGFFFPLSQEDLADILGLSIVHVNRTLQKLRGKGFLTMAEKEVTIKDFAGLAEFATFDPNYLHLRVKV